MHKYHVRFSDLFAQLGLASDTQSVKNFIEKHAPIHDCVKLEDAVFWTASQATLLKEAILLDANWAQVVDQLDAALREKISLNAQ